VNYVPMVDDDDDGDDASEPAARLEFKVGFKHIERQIHELPTEEVTYLNNGCLLQRSSDDGVVAHHVYSVVDGVGRQVLTYMSDLT